MRRPLATLAVAALLVLAGCSAGGGDTTTTPMYDTDVEPVYETPLDAETVATSHVDALRDHGSFTIDVNRTTRTGSKPPQTRETLIRANFDTGALYVHRKGHGDTRQAYRFANGTAYARIVSSGDVSYDTVQGDVGNTTSFARGSLSYVAGAFSFDYAGTTDVGGERVYVYRARGPEQYTMPTYLEEQENVTVDRAAATLYFRGDGTLHRLSHTTRLETDHRSWSASTDVRFQRLGDTDASPPGWIPTARNTTD